MTTPTVAADGPARATSPRASSLRQALAAPLLVAVAVQNLGNLALHAVLGRVLEPAQYGALGTLLALMVLLTVPLGALQAAASASAARDGGAAAPGALRRVIIWSTAAGVVALALSPSVVTAFHLDSWYDAALLGPFVTVSVILAVLRGRLLGVGRVRAVALTFLASVGVRLVVALALVGIAPVTGALAATLLGEVVALAIGMLALRGSTVLATAGHWLSSGEVLRSGAVIGGLFLFTTIDLFLARFHLAADDSGAYVAAATIGKTLLALPAAALAAAYPRLVGAGRGSRRPGELRRTALVVCGLAGLGALVVAAVPGVVLAVLYGGSYPDAGQLVRVLALVAGLSSVVSVATYALLAVRARNALLPVVGAVLEVVVIGTWHADALAVARGSAIAAAATSLAIACALVLDVRRLPVGAHEAPDLPRTGVGPARLRPTRSLSPAS